MRIAFALMVIAASGMPWTFVLWQEGIAWYERAMMSLVFGLALVATTLFLLDRYVRLPLNTGTVLGAVIGIAVLGALCVGARGAYKRRAHVE